MFWYTDALWFPLPNPGKTPEKTLSYLFISMNVHSARFTLTLLCESDIEELMWLTENYNRPRKQVLLIQHHCLTSQKSFLDEWTKPPNSCGNLSDELLLQLQNETIPYHSAICAIILAVTIQTKEPVKLMSLVVVIFSGSILFVLTSSSPLRLS